MGPQSNGDVRSFVLLIRVLKLVVGHRGERVVVRLAKGIGILSVLWIFSSLVSVTMGPVDIPISRVLSIILSPIIALGSEYSDIEDLIVTQLRLPRILVGGLVGMALGTAGATMQGLFRNPLVDPGIVGISAGGALGAVLCIALGLTGLFPIALPVFAFIGALAAGFLVYGIATIGGRLSMVTFLLAGIAISTFIGAIVSTIIVLLPNNQALRGILFWLAGGLDSRSWEHVNLAAPMILIGVGFLLVFSRDLNLLMLGDDDAGSLGVRVGILRPLIIVAACLVTGVAVAVSGTIAFVGLVVPHVLRLIFGSDHRILLPLSAIGGALFLVVSDTIARTIVSPAEIRVGIITALVGAPFFVFLLVRNKTPASF